MHSPSLRSMRGNPNASPEEHLDRIELSPRRPETPIEEQCGYSFQETRKMSANDEYRAFLAPSMLDFSDQQSLHLNSVPEVSSPDSEQELSKQMTSNDIANQRHLSTPPDSGLTIEWIWSVWWVEMFSSVLALECISAIMIILSIYRGQPLPHWPKLISINSLIAVFTAVFKAALILPVAEGLGQLKWNWFDRSQTLGDLILFDNASRGPWGSLLLMKSYILRPSIRGYLAGLGAFITVAALAIDAFSQATISLGSCNITADSGLAQVPRTNNYSGNPQRRDSSLDAAPITLNQKMRKAINKGLVDPPKTGELINFDCTSRNCTFTQDGGGGYFSSLGICYSCDDITDQAVLKFFTNKSAPAVNISMWSLPWSKNTSETILQRENGGTLLTMRPTPIQTYHNNSPPIYSFDILSLTYSKCDSCGPGVPSVARKPFAAQCRIDPCVRKYNATVTDGVYTEKVEGDGQLLKRRRATLGESKNENAFALLTESVLVDGTERKCKEVEERAINSVRVGLRQDGHFQEIFDNSSEISHSENLFWKTYPQECVWVVDRNSWQGMRETMTELLSGRVMTPEADSFQWLNGSVWGQQLFAAGNASISTVNNLVAGLAESMTATIRNDPYGTSEELGKNVPADLKVATGRVIITQTCIYVQWGYIAYPIALLALQWIFSTLVLIACSQRRRTGDGPARAVWKSSPLALLFHGLDEDLRVRGQSLETVRQMNSLADDVKVRLVPMKDSQRKGWHFAGA